MAEILTPERPPQIVRYSLPLGHPGSVKRGRGRSVKSSPGGNQVSLTIENGEFCFHLFPATLQGIAQAQTRGDHLQISKDLQSQVLMCSLLEESVIQTKHGKQRRLVHLQSGLTFQTCWYDASTAAPEPAGQGTKMMRTVVSLDGDILNQVSQSCLKHPLGLEIISAHYWLMEQLLQRNRSSLARLITTTVWTIPTICIGWNVFTNLGSLVTQVGTYDAITRIFMSLGSLAIPVIWDLSQDWLLPLLQLRLKRWIWRELTTANSGLKGLAQWFMRHS